jgi:hypothetical protein
MSKDRVYNVVGYLLVLVFVFATAAACAVGWNQGFHAGLKHVHGESHGESHDSQ